MNRILMAVALAAAFVVTSSAADEKIGKGPGPVVVPGESEMMTCPQCKDDYVVKYTTPPKGTKQDKAFLGKHLCEMCSTKLKTHGAGKAKTERAEHNCKNCTKPNLVIHNPSVLR